MTLSAGPRGHGRAEKAIDLDCGHSFLSTSDGVILVSDTARADEGLAGPIVDQGNAATRKRDDKVVIDRGVPRDAALQPLASTVARPGLLGSACMLWACYGRALSILSP